MGKIAGTKGRSGGSRKGAGRKTQPPEKVIEKTVVTEIVKPIEKVTEETVVMETQETPVNEKEKPSKKRIIPRDNLQCPIEFDNLPYAKQEWYKCIELDKQSKYPLLNERHRECLKSYCIAVEIRQRLLSEFEKYDGQMLIMTRTGGLQINPIITEINRLNDKINAYAETLGLTVTSEFKMAQTAKGDRLTGKEKKKDDSLFD